MAAISAASNLLFGLLALQVGLIDQDQTARLPTAAPFRYDAAEEEIAMPCALSRNARTLLVRCLSGEEIEPTAQTIPARCESSVSTLPRPAVPLELLSAFLHPLSRRIRPVLASRAQLVATLQAREGRGELPLFEECHAQVAVTLGMIGSQRDGLAVGSLRLVGSTGVIKIIAEDVVKVRMIGLQLDGTPASGDRLVKLALLAERPAELEVSHGIIRLEPDGLAIGDRRLVQPPGVGQRVAEVVSHSRAVGRSATATVKKRMASSWWGGSHSFSAIPSSWLIQKSAGKACWARRKSASAASVAPR